MGSIRHLIPILVCLFVAYSIHDDSLLRRVDAQRIGARPTAAEASPPADVVVANVVWGRIGNESEENTTSTDNNITTMPTSDDNDDDDNGNETKKKEREPVRGELWGILMSVVGFIVVAAMTGTLWLMARKKKREAAKRQKEVVEKVVGEGETQPLLHNAATSQKGIKK